MCLIVDANAASVFLTRKGAVIDWLLGPKGNPKLCIGGRLTGELEMIGEVGLLLLQLSRAGRVRRTADEEMQKHEKRLKSARLYQSNDVHVLALAIASGARTLATFDGDLSKDFKNPRIINGPHGRVYRDPEKHGHLLRHTPKSCGVSGK